MTERAGAAVHVSGVVQGVGFRPFVYSLATRLGLTGWVRNTSAGVDIMIDGQPEALREFLRALRDDAPPLARIDGLDVRDRPADGFETFVIGHSEAIADAFQPISPDVATCPDCLRELFDPADRRYRYPFINCTNCGPRFTIIRDLPYDRAETTMAGFTMCEECAAEYSDPLNRRFHAQPVACPRCGPQVWLEAGGKTLAQRDDSIQAAQELLRAGKIIAVKGLGGFHLACDAMNAAAVDELRRRKLRVDKPFAVMLSDLDRVKEHCFVAPPERALLESRERPIVILRRRPSSDVARQVCPGQDTLGVMLPYTPLHHLLLRGDEASRGGGMDGPLGPSSMVLVMTSGNVSEEPIATDNDEARDHLAPLADAFLMHDRDIRTRCDDSVVRVFAGASCLPSEHWDVSDADGEASSDVYPLRRSRSYAPFPVRMPFDALSVLAVGAELKNVFCLTRERFAFLSHHVGDLQNYQTLQSFEEGIGHFEQLFRVRPLLIAHDLHPDYLATRYARERGEREGTPTVAVQHHHAHIAACMAEHGLSGDHPVIGVAFDGTGYGEDGAIWGGEFLIADYQKYQRASHLQYIRMAGGDRAVQEPWRLALAWLQRAGVEWETDLPPVDAASFGARGVLRRQLERGLNAPLTSSMGRLFDAAAALVGVRQTVNYEAQAAIEFEALVAPEESGVYEFEVRAGVVDPAPLFRSMVSDLRVETSVPVIAARFHNGVAHMVLQVCRALRAQTGLHRVVLSGGVWQNLTLLARSVRQLEGDGFRVLIHRQVPPNDGGLALGQAVVAAAQSEFGIVRSAI